MENAAEALKYAFAIIVFVISISIAFMTISQARATSDIVTSRLDQSNYYPQYKKGAPDAKGDIPLEDVNGDTIMTVDSNGSRIVGSDTVISNLYRYYTEGFCVIIENSNPSLGLPLGRIAKFDLDTERTMIWNASPIERVNLFLSKSNVTISGSTIDGRAVGFGGTIIDPTNRYTSGNYFSIAEQSFVPYMGKSFRERFVETNYSGEYRTGEDGSILTITSGRQKVYITYTAI